MQTVPQPADRAPSVPEVDIGSAQHTALLRWHDREPVGDVMDALEASPRYPLIDGGRELQDGSA